MAEEHIDRIREQFGRTAEIYARMRQATNERSLAGLAALAGAGPEDRALDVACGPGFLTLTLAGRCREAVGIDATDAFLALARAEARERDIGNVRFVQGDVNALPFDDRAFDLVSCRAAFHHFPEPGAVLGEMVRVCKPGGRLLVADILGNESGDAAALHDAIERLCDPTHVRAVPASELERLFAFAELSTLQDVRSTMHYDVDEWIAHGDPPSEVREQIVERMRGWVDGDPAGLSVRHEDGRLRFTHQAAAFVLARP